MRRAALLAAIILVAAPPTKARMGSAPAEPAVSPGSAAARAQDEAEAHLEALWDQAYAAMSDEDDVRAERLYKEAIQFAKATWGEDSHYDSAFDRISELCGDPTVLEAVALERGEIRFSYRDCIQAYLAFLTNLGVRRLGEKGHSPWMPRRYAMPFAYDPARRHVREELGLMLGRAAVLADTLAEALEDGVDSARMRAALDAVAQIAPPDWLLADPGCVGEPVAAGAFAMDEELNNQTVYMIADVGAGTTDFCILCLKKRADGDLEPLQIRDGALSVEVAGDAVDAALVEFLVEEQAGEDYRARLAIDVPGIKERLFAATATDDEKIDHEFPDGFMANVNRRDFLESAHWRAFEDELRAAQAACLDRADKGYLQNYGTGAIRVVITGGGSALPLREALAEGRSSGAVRYGRVFVPDFPLAIRDRFAAILSDLARLAVSLGGSRDLLPGDYDRSDIRTDTGFTPPIVAAPFDKTRTGFEDEASAA